MKKISFPIFKRKRSFVKVAPTKDGNRIPIHISRMSLQHVWWWQSNVQPIIDKFPNRADRYWNWVLISALSNISGRFLARRPKGFTLGIDKNGYFIPCALIQLIGKFPFFIDHKKKSVFVWYLSVAPKEALLSIKDLKLSEDELPKQLGSISLDTAITYSFNKRRRGRTSLHATPKGGDELINWYVKRGMQILPKEEKLHFGFRRFVIPSDGRYCYYTHEGALHALEIFDEYRN